MGASVGAWGATGGAATRRRKPDFAPTSRRKRAIALGLALPLALIGVASIDAARAQAVSSPPGLPESAMSGYLPDTPSPRARIDRAEMRAFFDDTAAVPGPARRMLLFGKRKPAHDFWFRPLPMRNVAFASLDTSGGEPFIGLGYKRALGRSLDEPGYRFMATLGVKIRDQAPAAADFRTSRLHSVRAVFGREWHMGENRFGATTLALHAGASIVFFHPDVVLRTRKGGRLGPVAMGEIWHTWRDGPLGLSYSSLFAMAELTSDSAYLRMRHGFRLPTLPFSFGPEAALSSGGSQRYRVTLTQGAWRKARLGLHASDIAIRDLRLSLSGGLEWRHDRSTGAYAEVGAYIRY
jgi:hypothetical protein